jgi:hypothetical protein
MTQIRLPAGLFAASAFALTACAHQTTVSPDTRTAAAQVRAYIDPVSGQLLSEPPAGELKPLTLPLPDDSKIEILKLAGDEKGVRFHGQRRATAIATVDADGTVKTSCIEGTAADAHETH